MRAKVGDRVVIATIAFHPHVGRFGVLVATDHRWRLIPGVTGMKPGYLVKLDGTGEVVRVVRVRKVKETR